MSRHRLIPERTVYAPMHTETRSLGALAGGLVPIAGLAVLASFYSGPVAAVVPPELSSAQPVAAAPLFTTAVKPVIAVMDFSIPNSGRAAGKDDGDSARAASGASRSGSPSSPHGAAGRLKWGDVQPLHHFEGRGHEHWASSPPDGGHRRVRDGHWLHGGHRAAPGRHRHVDGHHADGGVLHHRDPAGRHGRADNHVGGHHQGAHSPGGHHAHR